MTGNKGETSDGWKLVSEEPSYGELANTLVFTIGYCMADRDKLRDTGMYDMLASMAIRLGVSRGYFYPSKPETSNG